MLDSLGIASRLELFMPKTKAVRSPAWFGCDALLTKGKIIVSYVNSYKVDHNKEDYPFLVIDKARLAAWDKANKIFINADKPLTPLSLVVEFLDGLYAMRVSASWAEEYEQETLDGQGFFALKAVKIPTKGFVKLSE